MTKTGEDAASQSLWRLDSRTAMFDQGEPAAGVFDPPRSVGTGRHVLLERDVQLLAHLVVDVQEYDLSCSVAVHVHSPDLVSTLCSPNFRSFL